MKRILLLCLLVAGCARAPLENPAGAFRLAEGPAELSDSFPIGTLRMGLERNITALVKGGPNVPESFVFGERAVTREEYRLALEALRPELESWEKFHAFVRANFEFYEVYGNEAGWGRVLSTGYYEPVVKGSAKRTAEHSRPLYGVPADLLTVDLAAFAERNAASVGLRQLIDEQKTTRPGWRARLKEGTKQVVPYFVRSEIDGGGVLNGRKLELAWMDPVDAFFLEIQGSGVVEMGGRRLRLGYASQNGAAYEPIGKFLTHAIPLPEMSMQRIRAHLATLSAADRDAVLFKNPSYVFFRPLDSLALTYSGAEVTAARTIATDKFLFPKGTLAFFDIEMPEFADAAAQAPASWAKRPRWVFDQDTGGAIRGGGRVDLFMGQGETAAQESGVMKREGRLWMLAPKPELVSRLRPAS